MRVEKVLSHQFFERPVSSRQPSNPPQGTRRKGKKRQADTGNSYRNFRVLEFRNYDAQLNATKRKQTKSEAKNDDNQ